MHINVLESLPTGTSVYVALPFADHSYRYVPATVRRCHCRGLPTVTVTVEGTHGPGSHEVFKVPRTAVIARVV